MPNSFTQTHNSSGQLTVCSKQTIIAQSTNIQAKYKAMNVAMYDYIHGWEILFYRNWYFPIFVLLEPPVKFDLTDNLLLFKTPPPLVPLVTVWTPSSPTPLDVHFQFPLWVHLSNPSNKYWYFLEAWIWPLFPSISSVASTTSTFSASSPDLFPELQIFPN